jgi:predicted phosphoadenosine phosphosulfate sulfurtransferase
MNDDRIEPLWLQVPIEINNATSLNNPIITAWADGCDWLREKEPSSIHNNDYGTMKFEKLFGKFIDKHFDGQRALCCISGVTAEESPSRFMGLTCRPTYKWITWGKKGNHPTFYPIYDWSYRDVWKSIHENNWTYCRIYDSMYQRGIGIKGMRISNVHHENSLRTLMFMQSIEPETWQRLVDRVPGIHAASMLGDEHFNPKQKSQLPPMFSSWRVYRDYLLNHIVDNEELKIKYQNKFANMDKQFRDGGYILGNIDRLHRVQISTILTNDINFTKLTNFRKSYGMGKKLAGKLGVKWTNYNI